MKFRVLLAAVFGLALATTQAATFTVTITGDSGPGSLRQAILDANATLGDDTIVFTTNGTIALRSPLPLVTDNTSIVGPGTNHLTISGNNAVQVFCFNAGTSNALSGLTIANGLATGYANGAAIANAGYLTVSNCSLVNNTNLYGWGGAIYNSGALAMLGSTLTANQAIGETGSARTRDTAAGGGAAGMGGGVFNMSGTVLIEGCDFTGNAVTGGDGGSPAFPNPGGTGRGGGVYGGGWCGASGGFGSGGGGAQANTCPGGNGGFGGGGGGGYGQAEPGGIGGFGGGGGGAGMGGAVFINEGSATIKGSSFQNNQATGCQGGGWGMGGGIFVNTGSVVVVNCSFVGNQVGGSSMNGPDFFNRAGVIMPQLTASSPGGGIVTVDPPTPPYLSNSWATITATPGSGWQFLYWLGDASGTNPTAAVKVTRNKFAEAVFGTPLTGSALMSLSPQSDFYPYGTVVKLTALPPAGTYSVSWSGNASGTNNPLSLAVNAPNQSVSYQLGTLSAGQFALTVIEDGRGHVVANPQASFYSSGQSVTIAAIPDAGQDFLGWTGAGTEGQNPLAATMTSNMVITASFTKRPSLEVGTPLGGLVEDGFRLTLTGEFGAAYAIRGSTNLTDWTAVGTVTNTYGTTQLTDPTAINLPRRFYRAVTN